MEESPQVEPAYPSACIVRSEVLVKFRKYKRGDRSWNFDQLAWLFRISADVATTAATSLSS